MPIDYPISYQGIFNHPSSKKMEIIADNKIIKIPEGITMANIS
jgi:hypothetical protein